MCDGETVAALLLFQVGTYADEAVKVFGISGGGVLTTALHHH